MSTNKLTHEEALREATVSGLLRRQFTKPKPQATGKPLKDQTAIVTGGNGGLGKEASRQLLKLGVAHLIIAVRSMNSGNETAKLLRSEFPSSQVSVWPLDLTSYKSIHAFVDSCAALPRLDIVILNAGILAPKHTIVPETGHEVTIQVTYLSNALLSALLLPVLKKQKHNKNANGTPPILTVVSSDAMYSTKLERPAGGSAILKNFDNPDAHSAFERYGISKLALLFFTRKLAEMVDPSQVLINSVNPGMTKGTNFFSENPYLVRKIVGLVQAGLARPVDVGATIYLDAILSYGAKSHGAFVSDWQIKPFPSICYTTEGKEIADQLWKETVEDLSAAGITDALGSLTTRV